MINAMLTIDVFWSKKDVEKGFVFLFCTVFCSNLSAAAAVNLIEDPGFENASIWLVSGGGGFSTSIY